MQKRFNIIIADCTDHEYNGQTIDSAPTGGIPLMTARLAEALAGAGCHVTVRNNTPSDISFKNVRWQNRTQPYDGPQPDIIMANNDAKIFDEYAAPLQSGAIPVLWIRNLVTWKRIFKKKRVRPLLRWRPAAVFLGRHQAEACSRLVPFRKRYIIPHAVSDDFFNYQPTSPRLPQALFLSKAYRGFPEVAKIWQRDIHPACPNAVLKAFTGQADVERLGLSVSALRTQGIHVMERAPQSVLKQEIAQSSCLLYPGHKDETFCNIAAEASVMGLPIVTRGIGSLKERLEHGSGFMATTDKDFANAAIMLLSNEDVRTKMVAESISRRDFYRWQTRIDLWFNLFSALRGAN